MKKALIVASVASMIDQFNMTNIDILLSLGYKVYVACNFEQGNTCSSERIDLLKARLDSLGVIFYQIDFERNIFMVTKNLKAYKQLKRVIKGNRFDLIHCHSPIGGLLTRIVARKSRKKGTKVIYTAHGFHFYRGAPIKNWLLYYPVEKLCARLTDILITINQEDYSLARRKIKARSIKYVPGIGVNIEKFSSVSIDREAKREELHVPENSVMLLSVGELNENKNHETVIRSLKGLPANIVYYIVGRGNKDCKLLEVAQQMGVYDRVKLLGFRNDVNELCNAADIYVFPSFREGLSVALMEAMASGLPCVVSRIRGNTDLIDENGGVLFDPHNVDECHRAIESIVKSDYVVMGKYNTEKIQGFGLKKVTADMHDIYGGI